MANRRCEYFDPRSVEEALELLSRHEGAKLLAGGQSLIPMITMGLSRPPALIDLRRIDSLRYVRLDRGELAIGALVRHQEAVTASIIRENCPLFSDAAAEIGHLHIRYRGTVGGSLAHADPAAEYVTAGLALDASASLVGPRGSRVVAVRDLVLGPLTTSMRPEELLTEIRVQVPPRGTGWSFRELTQRKGDFALVEVAVLLRCGTATEEVEDVRIAVGAATSVPMRCVETERRVRGKRFSSELATIAGQWASGELRDPVTDIHAPGEYRVAIAACLVRDALLEARARGGR